MSIKTKTLTPSVHNILINKGTEPPNSGKFIEAADEKHGSYLCRGCGQALFRESSQFTAHCGWPSFDDQIEGAVNEKTDADGRRTEIVCAGCDGHLGHVFEGEQYTAKNTRHCVNSLAIEFVESEAVLQTEELILAAGCFWGVEHILKQEPGVLVTEVGYTGGHQDEPTYNQVCGGGTGHIEAIRVAFDINKTNATSILKAFFECHDFTQGDGQGPDRGEQYLSVIFAYDDQQKALAQALIDQLTQMGHNVATQIREAAIFWPAEEDHQAYYLKNGQVPYCHTKSRIFDRPSA